MSKYDSISTAADLIFEVRMNGLSTDQDDRNRAADIFGRSGIGELAALANDEHCRSEDGRSTGKPSTSRTFYFIAFSIWNWEDATRFFNEHSNIQTKNSRVASLESEAAKVSKLESQVETCKHLWHLEEQRSMKAERELAEAQSEITALKAKLYDFMTAGV